MLADKWTIKCKIKSITERYTDFRKLALGKEETERDWEEVQKRL